MKKVIEQHEHLLLTTRVPPQLLIDYVKATQDMILQQEDDPYEDLSENEK